MKIAKTPEEETPSLNLKKPHPRRVFNILACMLLFFLYLLQGLIFGYYLKTLQITMLEKGASYASLAMMSILSYPFSFKWIMCPIVDTFFSERFGKRKTYVVPT